MIYRLLILITFSCVPTLASEVTASLGELKKVKENYVRTEESKRTILSDLYRLNTRIKRVNRERGEFEYQLNRTQKKVQELTGLVNQLEKQVQAQRVKLVERMKTLYKFGDQGFFRLAFSSERASDLDLGLRFLKKIVSVDYALLKDYQKNIKDLELQRSRLKTQVNRLSSLEEKVRQREGQLISQQKNKGSLLAQIDSSQILRFARLRALRTQTKPEEAEVQAQKLHALEDLFQPSFFERKGSLSYPTIGKIVRPFGDERDAEEPQIIIKQRGVVIQPGSAEGVSSVFRGKVVYADSLPFYGKTLIVDHGEHYFSIYSHLSNIDVQIGQYVNESQRIAMTGVDPFTQAPGLYFEIRHFSDPQDPKQWLKH